MTRELSKTEKALRLIAKEGITAKEAAERVGISPAAVSKGRLWPSKAAQNVRKLCEMENEIESLRSELATLTRQRDLAVEALKWAADVLPPIDPGELGVCVCPVCRALSTIKESEGK